MAAEVRIDFRIGGVDAAARAFMSVSQAAERAIRKSVSTERAANRERATGAKETARAILTEQRRVVSEERKLAREAVSVVRQANREKIAEERRMAREVVSVVREVNREKARVERDAARDAYRQEREAKRLAHVRGRAILGVVGGGVSGGMDGVRTLGRGAGAVVRDGTQLAGSLMGGAGVEVGLGHAIRGRVALEKGAVDLSNSGYQEHGKGVQTQRIDPKALMAQAQAVGQVTALDPTQALEGMAGFTKVTGDLATARAILPDIARLARATGTDLGQAVAAAGEMGKVMGDAAASEEEARAKAAAIMTVMKGLAGQGKLGSVELSDMAKHGARIASAASQFEGDAGANVMKIGMLAQGSRGGGGAWNAATAAASVSGLVTTFTAPERLKHFRNAPGGPINLKGEGGKLRDPVEIIKEAIDKTGGDIQKLQPMFANIVGARAMKGLSSKYLEGSGGKTDDESKAKGRAKVQEEIDRMTKGATMSDGDVNTSFAASMGTMEAKAQLFQQRIDKIAADLADKLIPAMLKFAPVAEKGAEVLGKFIDAVAPNADALAKSLGELAPLVAEASVKLADLVSWAVKNPALAGGAVVGGMALKGAVVAGGTAALSAGGSLAASGIGSAAGAAAGWAKGGAATAASKVAPVASRGVGLLGRAAPILGTAGAVAGGAALGLGAGSWATGKADEQWKGRQALINESMSLGTKLKSGEGTDADKQRALDLVAQLSNISKNPTMNSRLTGLVGDNTTENAGAAATQLQEAISKAQFKLDPSSTVQLDPGANVNVTVTNAAELSGALQRPGAQPPGP